MSGGGVFSSALFFLDSSSLVHRRNALYALNSLSRSVKNLRTVFNNATVPARICALTNEPLLAVPALNILSNMALPVALQCATVRRLADPRALELVFSAQVS